MKIILENNIQKLIPTDESNFLLSKEDTEKQEEEKYYFKFAYLPSTITLEEANNLFIETQKPEEEKEE